MMSKCQYKDCPYDSLGRDFCYFHRKVLRGDMKVYLTEDEIERANSIWNRETPDWVGLKRITEFTVDGIKMVKTDLIDVDWRNDERQD